MSSFLRKLLKDGAEIAAAIVEKGVDELERAEQRRRQFGEKAVKKVGDVVEAVEKRREAFDQRTEQRRKEFANVLGDLLGEVLGGGDVSIEPDTTVKPVPAKLDKPAFKAPAANEVSIEPDPSVKPAKKRAAPKKKSSAGKKLTR